MPSSYWQSMVINQLDNIVVTHDLLFEDEINGHQCPFSFKGSPYWMAPEIAAMFKIGNSKELAPIPDHLSEQGENFIKKCLHRDPCQCPLAIERLQHPFIQIRVPLEKSVISDSLEI